MPATPPKSAICIALTIRLHAQLGLDAGVDLLVVRLRQVHVLEAARRVALHPLHLQQVAHLHTATAKNTESTHQHKVW